MIRNIEINGKIYRLIGEGGGNGSGEYTLTEEDLKEIADKVKFSTVVQKDIDGSYDLEVGTEYKIVPSENAMSIAINILWDGGYCPIIQGDMPNPFTFKFVGIEGSTATYEFDGETVRTYVSGLPTDVPINTSIKFSSYGYTVYRPTEDGKTPEKGIDYFTPEDVEKIVNEVAESVTTARTGTVTISADKWTGTSSPYAQVVTVEGVTKKSQVDLTPSDAQLAIFHEKDLAFVTSNYRGVVTVSAIGQKPMNDYEMQVTITEVEHTDENSPIIGVTVGTPISPSKIEEKINPVKTVNGIEPDENGNVEAQGDDSIPEYVKAEAEAVIDRVIEAQGNRTFTFACITDLHYGSWGYYEGITDYPDGIKHACQALKYIDERLKLDAVAVLGDYTDGMAYDQYDTAVYDFKGINAVLDKLRFSPNLRLVGNHDFHVKHSPLTYRYITAYSDNVEWGDCLGGYFYKDFIAQKIRVICLNTSEINHTSVSPTAEQYQWFVNSLDLSTKENASDWHILILSHIPLDFYANGGAYKFANILNAYQTSGTWSDADGVSCDFSNGKNVAKIVGNIHGHIHNLKVDKLYHGGSSTEQINVWRMATPNACFGKENKYDGYQEDTAYLKTANSASDTAFCVYCIDLDTYTIKAICYGAGYDRELNYDSGIIGKSYSIANNLTNVTNSNTTKSIAKNGSYSATLTATAGEITSVTITMGGVDITSTAYSNGNINISTVTGNIVITAIAEVEEPEEPDEPIQIINQIPISTDIGGNIYNGKGYKENTRWSGSSNADSGYDGVDVTGYIPITYGDTIRFKNITLTAGTPKNEVWYFEVKGTSYFHRVVGEFLNEELDENGNLIGFTAEVTGFMRVVASNIDDTSIITKNQPID